METLLGMEGAFIDGLFLCPHHTDRGFEGERLEYKIDCECRKPKAGLFIQAQKTLNIDLSQSYMVGDSAIDIKAAEQMPIEYRKCICKHPIEWDATVIDKLSDTKQDKQNDQITVNTDYISYLKNVAKVTDIWKEGLSKIFKTNSLYFAHPLYFINHFEKCGAFEFNPYPEEEIYEIIRKIQSRYAKKYPRIRFSFGIQSFDNEVLQLSGRHSLFLGLVEFLRGLQELKTDSTVFNFDFIAFGKRNQSKK